jgi:glycosyltransferase involved in cell wall biosynthesis
MERFVRFIGYVSDRKLFGLYKDAQAFIFPSLSEGFGLPGLEAMASGTPVLASDIPVFREVYSDAVLYFNPEDVDDIANKIMQILTDKNLRAALVLKGKSHIRKYSWRKMAKETKDIYESCLSL